MIFVATENAAQTKSTVWRLSYQFLPEALAATTACWLLPMMEASARDGTLMNLNLNLNPATFETYYEQC